MLCWFFSGGDSQNPEDAKTDDECCTADRTGRNPEKHVYSAQEDDKGADRVAYRTQVHETGLQRQKQVYISRMMTSEW